MVKKCLKESKKLTKKYNILINDRYLMSNTEITNNIDRISKYGDKLLQYPHYWPTTRSIHLIIKEFGGVFYDNHLFCNIDDIIKNTKKDVIYIGASNSFLFFTNYSLNFLAMERNHPIWEVVWKRLDDINAINNALINSLNSSDKYEIIEIFFQHNGKIQSWQKNKSFVQMKQLFMVVLVIFIILFVEQLYHYNVSLYGAVSFIPGIGVVSNTPTKPKKKSTK